MHLEEVFGPDGPLARALPGYRPRPQQQHMAERVAAAIDGRWPLVIEAGTGTGKTFAYLVPALLSGRRVLISTGTRTLQDQLFGKDLPLVSGAIGRPVRVALLKGRANYLCRERLARTTEQRALERRRDAWLGRIERWARITRTGDLAEVPGLSDSHPLWSQVTSTRESCLGVRCEEFARCHVVAARRAALEADLVIVNHHLLLADLALKEDGFGDLLGSADAVILDEAHQVPDLAMQFFGASVGSRRIEHLLQELAQELMRGEREGRLGADGARALRESAAAGAAVQQALSALTQRLPRSPGRSPWEGAAADTAVLELAHAFEALASALTALGEDAALEQLGVRSGELAAQLNRIGDATVEGARSIEITVRGFQLHLLPFDVAERFAALMQAHAAAWIFTSATLSVGESFTHFTSRLGLEECETAKIDSPFDFMRQSLLYLPTRLPPPASSGYLDAVLAEALPLIEASRGGAFVLFTSHRALADAAARVRALWGESMPFRLYVQGEAPREQLLASFRADGDGVLMGTASFWEGVDVKGSALRLVIIDKLPFASPEDPIVKARIEHIEAHQGNAFRQFQLPEAALALKQGVGRLIRSEEDHGTVVICDPRLTERPYGRVLLGALPPMRRTRDARLAAQFLRANAPQDDAPRSLAEPA